MIAQEKYKESTIAKPVSQRKYDANQGLSFVDNRKHIPKQEQVIQSMQKGAQNEGAMHNQSTKGETIQMVNWKKTIGGALVTGEAVLGGITSWGNAMGMTANGLKTLRGVATAALGLIDPTSDNGKWWGAFVDYICDAIREAEGILLLWNPKTAFRGLAKIFRGLAVFLTRLLKTSLGMQPHESNRNPIHEAVSHVIEVISLLVESASKKDTDAIFGYITAFMKAVRTVLKISAWDPGVTAPAN